MEIFEEILPRRTDVGSVAVVGSLVNEEADVEVAGSFGINIEELEE